VVVLTLFIVWASVQTLEEDEVIIPNARLSETPGAPITQQTTQRETTQTTSARRSVSQSQSQAQSSLTSAVSTSESALIGAISGSQGGAASPFGMGQDASGSFKATFYGTGGNARRLVYLIDASGSLIDTLPFVIQELKRSIGELSERQSFAVIFFQGDDAIEVPPPGLRAATSARKAQVISWVDTEQQNVIAIGGTNPIKALQRALQMGPQLMFLLSDNITGNGRFEVDQRRLLREIERVNRAKTKINTIQFIYPDPLTSVGMEATLKLIADRSGGIYKFLDARELGLR